MSNASKPCIQKSQRRYKAYWEQVSYILLLLDCQMTSLTISMFSVIGIVVFCGPIRTRFVYSMDDLVENGANMMIEVMRQAFHDLGTLLADHEGKSYKMPKTSFLQFDNCGVNKVR